MTDPFAEVQEALDAARDAWVAAEAPEVGVDGFSGAGLVALNRAVGVLRGRVDAVHARVAARLASASRPELGSAGLARQEGFRSVPAMIAATTGTSAGQAAKLVVVGEATRPVERFGVVAAPKYPVVADAVAAGLVGVDAAAAIVGLLERVALRAGREVVAEAERTLVGTAPGLAMDRLAKVLQRAEAVLDPEGVPEREDALRAGRGVQVREDRTGMVHVTATLDPETAAPVVTALDALVGVALRTRDENTRTGSGVGEDTRTVPMIRADALAAICRHLLGCEKKDTPTGGATVIVRMTLADLVAGVGQATIDGITQPVSAGTVRRLAADAKVIPAVLGGESEVLDWGRAKRLFTPAQKLAITERDGGCVGCGLPPSMCQVHHLLWWDRDHGPTNLDTAVLLCGRCHHLVHDDGWEIRVDGTGTRARVWLIPPAHVDPTRTPRLGGRHRHDYTPHAAA